VKPRRLLSNSIVYGLGSVANRLIGLAFLAVYTRYLAPSDFGVVGLLSSVAMLLLPLFSCGLSTSLGVCYFSTADPQQRARVIRSGRVICALSAAMLLLISVVDSARIAALVASDPRYAPHTQITLVGVALSLLSLPLQQKLQFDARAVAYVIASLAGVATNVVVSVIAVAWMDLAALGLIFGTTFGQAITWLVLIVIVDQQRTNPGFRFSVVADLLRHGLPMIPSFAMLFVIQNGARWPLEWTHGMEAVGLYALGATIGTAITVVTTSVTSAWMPHALAQGSEWPQARVRIAEDFLRYCVLVGILLVLFFIGAQPFLRLFAAEQFHAAWTVIGLSASSHVLVSLFSMMLPPVYLAKKVAQVLVSQSIAMVFAIATFSLIGPLGIVGAALSVLAGSTALVVAQWGVNKRIRTVAPIPLNIPALLRIAGIVTLVGLVSSMIRLDDPLVFGLATVSLLITSAVGLLRELPGGWRAFAARRRKH